MNANKSLSALLVLISVGQLSLSAPTGAPTGISNSPFQGPPQPRGRAPLADRLSADDFIVSETQYQQILDRLYEESSASPESQSSPNEGDFNSGDFVAQDASIEEILRLIEESNQSNQPNVPAIESGTIENHNSESISHDHQVDNEDHDEECAICLEGYRLARPKVKLNCGHEFHFTCIDDWCSERSNVGRNARCPICRAGIFSLQELALDQGLPPGPVIRRATVVDPFDDPITRRRASGAPLAAEATTEVYVPTPITSRSAPTSTSRAVAIGQRATNGRALEELSVTLFPPRRRVTPLPGGSSVGVAMAGTIITTTPRVPVVTGRTVGTTARGVEA